MKSKRFRVSMLVGVVAMLGATFAGVPAHASDDCATTGCWSKPFSRAGLWDAAPPATPADSVAADPAAASAVVLPNGQILYWNGLQNLENCGQPLAANAGDCAGNSKSEILDLTGTGNVQDHFYPVATNGGDDLFCSDQRLLADGRVVAAGGTHWEEELGGGPGVAPGAPSGLAELYGSKNTHVFGGSWSQFDDMAYGRWYPTMITMPDGKLYVAGGTSKLLWNSNVLDSRASQPYPVNVNQTETLDPATGHWTYNGASADITLPQFARMHLLPDGEILYTGIGQMWGPAGESVDELKWNWESIYNPATKTWTQQALAQFGSRSGAFSAPLPIAPDANGNYNTAKYLIGGGVLGTDPGTELATNFSEIVTASANGSGAWTSTNERTGDMVNHRWYSSAVTLPNGQVLAFSGANVDEVVVPGIETAVHQAELYDPATGKWTGLSSSARDRTYHNSALLLADGSVLVGGHAPINQAYGGTGAVGNDKNGFSNNLKDPAFERFFPPYLSHGTRPQIMTAHPGFTWGDTDVEAATLAPGSEPVAKLELVRLPSVTHTTDADNRTVVLNFHQNGTSLHIDKVPSASVLPPGYYYLFALSADGTPAVAPIVKVSADGDTLSGTVHPVNLVSTPLR
jgi:hypothetical protein